ncbi:MAG: hypothetical protein GXY54_07555 [Deltaproteobacteria bacterium]|nr:hypothetical protein [Deltaproteobacteria bacterium]
MDWTAHLDAGEKILWEGCPAPRCYCFRNWRRAFRALAGGGLTLLLWLLPAHFPWRLPLMLAALGTALWFFPGGFVRARLQWNTVFYAATDRSLLAVGGCFPCRLLRLPRAAIEKVDVNWLGKDLATVAVWGQGGRNVEFSCLEHPHRLIALLSEHPPLTLR